MKKIECNGRFCGSGARGVSANARMAEIANKRTAENCGGQTGVKTEEQRL